MSLNHDSETFKIELLQGSKNYRTWKFSVRMILQAKDLWDVVSGKEARPATGASEWDKKAGRALAIIALALSAEEKEHIIDCDTPKEAWEVLEKLYEGKGRNRKFMLLQELFKAEMEENGSMDVYLRTVREKMSELAVTGLKLEDDIKLAIIFNGLPEKYRYLVVSFENKETIDFDELSARLREEELRMDPTGVGGKTAMSAMRRKLTLKCWNCGEKGHVKADCPKPDKTLEKAEAKFAM